MGLLARRQKGVMVWTGMAKLSIIGLIMALATAFINTIWAIYLDTFVQSVVIVGLLTAFFTFVAFISRFLFIPLVEKVNKSKIYALSILSMAVAYTLFSINTNFYFLIILATFLTMANTLRVTSFGIIVRDRSSEKKLSRNEGLLYTFLNVAWVIGPLIAGYVSERYSISLVFMLAAIFAFLSLFLFKISNIKDSNIKKKADYGIMRNFFAFFKNKNRTLAYILGGGVNLWWSLVFIFIPLFMIRNNLNKIWVGWFLFGTAVPLILFEYFFGKLAGKIGFKKIFKIGFLIPAVLSLVCFFIGNIFIILALLILASIGLAMLEPTTEAYFFDVLKGKQSLRFYGPYNTAISVNAFIGRFAPSILLIFFPFKFIFLLFAGFMFLMVLVSFFIKDVIESRRDGKNN